MDFIQFFKKLFITITIITILYLIIKNSQTIILKIMNKLDIADENETTIENLIYYTVQIIIITLSIMYILSVWGISIGPLLAGAGIVGITVGLGAQSVLKDLISGFVLMLTNSFGIGDNITITTNDAEIQGTVITISLRSTTLHTPDGNVVLIPNSEIETITFVKPSDASQVETTSTTPQIPQMIQPHQIQQIQ